MLKELKIKSWKEAFSPQETQEVLAKLEEGSLLYFPLLPFELEESEKKFLTPAILSPESKNVSWDHKKHELKGAVPGSFEGLCAMLERYCLTTLALVTELFPSYADHLTIGRTSFRPAQVKGRPSSYKKDDTRLHVDAFPSKPLGGMRILRMFSNVHPGDEPRVWRIGEPFEKVATNFLPTLSGPLPLSSLLLHLLHITKERRAPYDHYMLQLHDHMKKDMNYQSRAAAQEVRFPPRTSWIVQTDQVSHAALSGQFLLEQTFYLPVSAMGDPQKSPLKILERLMGKSLMAL